MLNAGGILFQERSTSTLLFIKGNKILASKLAIDFFVFSAGFVKIWTKCVYMYIFWVFLSFKKIQTNVRWLILTLYIIHAFISQYLRETLGYLVFALSVTQPTIYPNNHSIYICHQLIDQCVPGPSSFIPAGLNALKLNMIHQLQLSTRCANQSLCKFL